MQNKDFKEARVSERTALLLRAKTLVAQCAGEVNEIVDEPDDERAQKAGEIIRRNFKVIDEVLNEQMISGINENLCRPENVI